MSALEANYRMGAISLFAIATIYFAMMKEYIPAIITMTAGFSYVAMYLREQDVLAARYADWSITTPLILFVILTKAKMPIEKVLFVMAADFFMVITGYLGKREQDQTKKMVWYWLGMILFVPVVIALMGAMKSQKAAVLSLIIWLAYPLVWIAAEKGSISPAMETNITALLDVTAKVGFGVLSNLE